MPSAVLFVFDCTNTCPSCWKQGYRQVAAQESSITQGSLASKGAQAVRLFITFTTLVPHGYAQLLPAQPPLASRQ